MCMCFGCACVVYYEVAEICHIAFIFIGIGWDIAWRLFNLLMSYPISVSLYRAGNVVVVAGTVSTIIRCRNYRLDIRFWVYIIYIYIYHV